MDIIAISGKARSGKDTIAKQIKQLLEEQGEEVLIAHYGDFLKHICTQYYNWDGSKDKKGRTILQTVGQCFRDNHEDVWVNMMIDFIIGLGVTVDVVLIPDCRYLNEILKISEECEHCYKVRIDREDYDNGLTDEQKRHPSEIGLDNFDFDLYVKNGNISEEEFLNKAERIVQLFNIYRGKTKTVI